MFTEQEKDGKEILIVVLDGLKVLSKKTGVAPLRYALREVVKPEDQVEVLAVFNSQEPSQSPVNTPCCIGGDARNHQPAERKKYINSLKETISQRTEAYMKIFRPFHSKCKSIGVKFSVKIVLGTELDAIVMEEANNTGATLVVIERTFGLENTPWLSRRNHTLSSPKDKQEIALYTCMHPNDVPESSGVGKAVFPAMIASMLRKKRQCSVDEKPIYCVLPNFEGIYQPSSSSPSTVSLISREDESSEEIEDLQNFNNSKEEETRFLDSNRISTSEIFRKNHALGFPMELSWEVISEITDRFGNIIHVHSNEDFQMYSGFLEESGSRIFVKRYQGGNFSYVLEAEKKAALTMYHKNILGLLGYHQNENAMALVFPYGSKGSLMDRFLNGFWTKELEIPFPDKLGIAIGIAQGIRYMHEQCPRGPIAHGDLRPCNILLTYNLQPQITGFGRSKWLKLEQSSPTSIYSCGHKHPTDPESLALLKSDILAFGILLLRLFCNRSDSASRDDKDLLAWARPLLAQRAYHLLYDEAEHDFYGLFVVTYAAAQCIRTRPNSRPCMSEVLSFLKGEISCADHTSPLSDNSPSMISNQWLNSPMYRLSDVHLYNI